MNPALFTRFRELIYEQSGISLSEGKRTLLQSRIGKRMKLLGLAGEEDYLNRVVDDRSGEEVVQLLDAVSTNVTYFFREPDHFDRLGEVLRELIGAGQARLRLWSAACSSGQEPYSMAMTAMDMLHQAGNPQADLRLLATDISTRVLQSAIGGEYTERELERVPAEARARYLDRLPSSGEKRYVVREEIRRLVTFRRLNLSKPPFPMKGPFDAIFCRNVMIYFDDVVRGRLVADMVRLLRPGGLLFIGHAESLLGITAGLQTVAPSVYRKVT